MTFDIDQARVSLAATPSVLRGRLAGLPPAWLSARPADGEWSAHQVTCHFAYVEETDWLQRVRIILEHGPGRTFDPVDHGDQTDRYAGVTTDAVAERFARVRESNLAALEVGEADLERPGTHPTLGRVTMRQLLATWVVHDLNHLAQIDAALASFYVGEVGPWHGFLGILEGVEAPPAEPAAPAR
jgi:hypothetical protein